MFHKKIIILFLIFYTISIDIFGVEYKATSNSFGNRTDINVKSLRRRQAWLEEKTRVEHLKKSDKEVGCIDCLQAFFCCYAKSQKK